MGARKPLATQEGHLTKEQIQKKEFEEKLLKDAGHDQLQTPPDWLVNNIARDEWRRLVKEFTNNKSIINNLDYNNLGAYCNAFAKWTLITKELGMKLNAGRQINPLVTLELKYSDEVKKYAVMLGLTAEGKLKTLNAVREIKEGEVKDEFGDI